MCDVLAVLLFLVVQFGLPAAVPIVFFCAAFVHWKRTRAWWLLMLALAPLAALVALCVCWLGGWVVGPDGVDRNASEQALDVASWCVLSGLVLATIGGLGAILSIGQQRHRSGE